jgi:mono/diheme cytochrome c family protein
MLGIFVMRFTLFFITPLFLYATSDFITQTEYAAQLYKNPRGIGCHLCHGIDGNGKLIANYSHKGVKKSFRGPKITGIAYKDFYKALNERKNGMPRYFLTQKEVEALYLYLHLNDKKRDDDR